jgi:hypothetical protein
MKPLYIKGPIFYSEMKDSKLEAIIRRGVNDTFGQYHAAEVLALRGLYDTLHQIAKDKSTKKTARSAANYMLRKYEKGKHNE